MTLNSTGFCVGGTLVSSSVKIWRFDEEALANALDVINKIETFEYEQTQYLVGQYTTSTPQSHQSKFIALLAHM
ncbi:MAG: hypothetical protein ACKPKO_35770, partial [Candidatus Fonsibacter sp.]